MNKFRRKEIYNIINRLSQLLKNFKESVIEDISIILEEIIFLIQCIFDEEEMYKDNVPENLQSGDRYQDSETACDNLESAIEILEDIDFEEDEKEDIISAMSEAIDYLNNSTV